MNRRLRSSVLFTMMQEAAIAHTEALGMGRAKTLDRGILWIVTMQRVEIHRLPCYDEEVLLRSWPGPTMHLLFPRYFSLSTPSGETLLQASSLWSLIDGKSRGIVFPENYGIQIDGFETGAEIPMPSAPAPLFSEKKTDQAGENSGENIAADKMFTVPYSFVDLNGHMNNTRYMDLAEDLFSENIVKMGGASDFEIKSAATEFSREIRYGEQISLQLQQKLFPGEQENTCRSAAFLRGIREDGQAAFRIRFEAELSADLYRENPK